MNIRNKDNITPLHDTAKYGRTAIACLLIDHGAELEAQDDTYGNTPLILASLYGNKDIVEMLLKAGADVQAINKEGKNALSYARLYSHSEIVKLLTHKAGQI